MKFYFSLISEKTKLAYGIVFLVRKKGGNDNGQLYAMKILKKSAIVQKVKTAEHTKTERQVSEWNPWNFSHASIEVNSVNLMHTVVPKLLK